MVASVGPSYTVLSLFQKPSGSAATADTTAVDAIIDQIHQMKADASSARLQGASAATQAWIESSEASEVDVAESSKTSGDIAKVAEGASASSGASGSIMTVSSIAGMPLSLSVYNHFITTKDGVVEQMNERRALIETTKDPVEKARLSKIVKQTQDYLDRQGAYQAMVGRDLGTLQSRMEEDGFNISGNILSKQNDGTYQLGQFTISNKEGKVYWDHDGSGIAKVYNNAGQLAELVSFISSVKTEYLADM
ncbi:hypothetical protein [Azorhizobium sp. AG788]|uniref:hypothetical protein n=1 Tax=Azorhizobium sp. AG788 TaxID=2183897 RepID=UPI00313933E4